MAPFYPNLSINQNQQLPSTRLASISKFLSTWRQTPVFNIAHFHLNLSLNINILPLCDHSILFYSGMRACCRAGAADGDNVGRASEISGCSLARRCTNLLHCKKFEAHLSRKSGSMEQAGIKLYFTFHWPHVIIISCYYLYNGKHSVSETSAIL